MQTHDVINKKAKSQSQSKSQDFDSHWNRNLPAYDMSLIGALESDHDQLLDLYTNVLKAARNQKYSVLQLALVDFATTFTDHIQVEDELLYGYLKIMARNKTQLEQKIVADFSSEMKNISISIITFLTQSPHIPVNESNVDCFLKEFQIIGSLLQDRIQREEKVLYPIYNESRKVVNIS